jgi:hypothetical protein
VPHLLVICTLSVIIEEKGDFPPHQKTSIKITPTFLSRMYISRHDATSASCSIYLQILHIAMLTDTFYTK